MKTREKKKNKTKPDGNLEGMASRDQLSALTCAPLPPSTQPDPTERYGYRYLALILNSRLIHQICVLTSSTAAAVAAFPVRSLSKQAGFDSKLGHLTRIQTCVASRRHLRFPSPPTPTPPPLHAHTQPSLYAIYARVHTPAGHACIYSSSLKQTVSSPASLYHSSGEFVGCCLFFFPTVGSESVALCSMFFFFFLFLDIFRQILILL